MSFYFSGEFGVLKFYEVKNPTQVDQKSREGSVANLSLCLDAVWSDRLPKVICLQVKASEVSSKNAVHLQISTEISRVWRVLLIARLHLVESGERSNETFH